MSIGTKIQRINLLRFSVLSLTAIIFISLCAVNMWVNDDAYISFRVVDNFVNGYGLTWNIDERVQPYTNPLWTFLHIPFYYFLRDIYITTISLSLACALLTFLFLTRPFYKSPLILLSCIALPMILSKAMVDFSTSGLEAILSSLLLAYFFLTFLSEDIPNKFLKSFLLISLIGLNRLDLLLIVFPASLLIMFNNWKNVNWKHLAIGFSPLLLWFLFSLLYYGFLFPNTKYAKLETGFPIEYFISQGIQYFLHLIKNDLITSVIILIAVILPILPLKSNSDETSKLQEKLNMVSLGIILYSFYIIYVGGDFMSGRLWAPLFTISLIIISFTSKNLLAGKISILKFFIVFQLCLYGVTQFTADQRITNEYKISDERQYYKSFGISADKPYKISEHKWALQGIFARESSQKSPEKYVITKGSVGLLGFYAGADTYIIDGFALTDPLLARMPTSQDHFRIGHFWRDKPKGYFEARSKGDFSKMDPNLRAYYKKLHLIISGPIFDLERLKTIIKFNLGEYDHLMDKYLASRKKDYLHLK